MSHVNPRILASNEAQVEARRKGPPLRWRDSRWLLTAVAIVALIAIFPIAKHILGVVMVLLLATGFWSIARHAQRERRIWPHRWPWALPMLYAVLAVLFLASAVACGMEMLRYAGLI